MATVITLTATDGQLAGRTYRFEGPCEITVGRGKDCGLVIPAAWEFMNISRHHCLIAVAPCGVRVHDLGSHNGTLVNGMQIGRPAAWHLAGEVAAQPCWEYDLCDGDELRIGGLAFRVGISAEKPRRHAAPTMNAARELQTCS